MEWTNAENAIKDYRQGYEKVFFKGKYDEDLEEHLEYFMDMCNDHEVHEVDRLYFWKCLLRHGVRQYYKRVVN